MFLAQLLYTDFGTGHDKSVIFDFRLRISGFK